MNNKHETGDFKKFFFIHAPHVSWRKIDDSVVAINNKDGLLQKFNEVASIIWQETRN
jgi:hypothetical protein